MFGAARKAYKKVVSHLGYNFEQYDPTVPSPAHYTSLTVKSNKDKYTLRPKSKQECKQILLSHAYSV